MLTLTSKLLTWAIIIGVGAGLGYLAGSVFVGVGVLESAWVPALIGGLLAPVFATGIKV